MLKGGQFFFKNISVEQYHRAPAMVHFIQFFPTVIPKTAMHWYYILLLRFSLLPSGIYG
jgi:hypothetical protein